MKTFLINEIGLSNLAATTLRDDHGFDLFNAFQSFLMTDIDDIYTTQHNTTHHKSTQKKTKQNITQHTKKQHNTTKYNTTHFTTLNQTTLDHITPHQTIPTIPGKCHIHVIL